MTDERLGTAAGAWLRDIDRPSRDSRASVQRAMKQVRTTQQVRRWLPLPAFDRPAPIREMNGRTRPRGFTMFSAVKFVVASVIVALFGGFLLAGVLTTPQGAVIAPAAVTEPSPGHTTDSGFPLGTFTALEHPGLVIEFRPDGTATSKWDAEGWENLVRYATNGEFFTEMTHEADARKVPATYYWDFDGELLRFETWGEDVVPVRATTYANTFRFVQDPVEVTIAAVDIPAGETVYSTWAITGIAPAAEVGPDAFTDFMDVIGSVAAADIAMGQPITADMLEPSSE